MMSRRITPLQEEIRKVLKAYDSAKRAYDEAIKKVEDGTYDKDAQYLEDLEDDYLAEEQKLVATAQVIVGIYSKATTDTIEKLIGTQKHDETMERLYKILLMNS